MMEKIQIWLIGSGTEVFIFLLVLFLVALIANFVVKRIFLLVLDRLLEFTTWDEYLEVERFKIIPRLANIIPALVIDIGLSFANNIPDKLLTILQNVTDSFIILTIVKATTGLRVDKEEELNGLDLSEHGMEAYADFRTNEG